jgi:hypothetical protein
MAWYKWALIAGGILICAHLLKAVPRQYEEVAALGAFLLVFVAIPLLMRKARSSAESASAENQVSAQDLLNNCTQYSLYLRSFESDGTRPGEHILRRHLFDAYGMPEEQYEVSLISTLNIIAPVIAIGRPASSSKTQLGAARYYVTDDENWQDKVKELIEAAKLIVVRADAFTPGLEWELETIRKNRNFKNTSIILSTAPNRSDVYHTLLTLLPSGIKEGLPTDVGKIQALYIDSSGECQTLEKSFGITSSVEEWVNEEIIKLVREDSRNTLNVRGNKYKFSAAGVRCWHREGLGMTTRKSYAGKVLISNEKFIFLSSGASQIGKIMKQGSKNASENLTQGLNLQAVDAEGSIQVDKRSLLSVDVKWSLVQTPHLRVKYQSDNGEKWCSLAFDGMERNTIDNLTEMAKHLH